MDVRTLLFKADEHGKGSSGKVSVEQALKVHRGSRGIVLFVISEIDGGGWSTLRPGRFYPRERELCPLYRMLGGPQARSGRVRKIPPPTAIRSPERPARSESLFRLSYPGPRT